ncbi:hypothetical protein CVT24_004374 [Panaeolus cyanescens]|uniref:F-box domain-containing protein n=1 Tax=Panaeolus cyanescens TaxID=181874 RepID=A0A409V9Z6_9AGAR|nr:hypothetical protein CVT24_004374 [Panaeolus cyanescens]
MSGRRSTRQKAKTAEAAPMDVDDDSTFEDDGEDEFEEPQDKKRKRRAPRATRTQQNSGSVVKKARTRGTRGVLKQMLEMPFDILFEIFGHLEPADLLSVGRTSQELRELVMSKQFKSIWVHARSKYPDMPSCPDDMTEPAYAELVFGNSCLVSITVTVFAVPPPFLNAFPFSYTKWHFSSDHLQKWNAETISLNPANKTELYSKRIAERMFINEHAEQCEAWYPTLQSSRRDAKDAEINERKAQIVELVKSMGWGEELSKMTSNLPQDSPEVVKHCKKKLSDRIMENLKPFLEEFMANAKEKRILGERRACYESRMRALQTAYNNALTTYPLQKPRPRVADVFEIPRFKSLVMDTPDDVTVTDNDFDITPETLAGVMEEANTIVKSKLLSVVATELKEGTYDPATVLDLATTTFVITSGYDKKSLHTSRVIVDSRTGASPPHDEAKISVEELAARVFPSVPFNSQGTIAFNTTAHEIFRGLLETCGLDPNTTTCAEMDEKHPIIECLKCNQMIEGRLIMRWSEAARHARNVHSANYPAEFVPIEGEDVVRAKRIIDDADEQRRYGYWVGEQTTCVCLLCNDNNAMTLPQMRAHFTDQHDALYPKYKADYDLVYQTEVSPSRTFTDTKPNRRSARQTVRLAAHVRDDSSMCIDEETPHESIEEFDSDFEEPDSNSKKRKHRAPRSKNTRQAQGQPSMKKARKRGTRGVFKEWPMDIMFEVSCPIFDYLLPADLLSLGRVSQGFKDLVMSTEFKSTWKHARSKFPGMPDCPSDMNEPAYAELMFGNTCLVSLTECGKVLKSGLNETLVWQARTRLCTGCFEPRFDHESLFLSRPGRPHPFAALEPSLRPVLPSAWLTVKSGYSKSRYPSVRHATQWNTELASLTTPQLRTEWCQAKIAEMKSIHEHAKLCEEWFPTLLKHIQDGKDAAFRERKDRVVQFIHSMGWGDELSKMTSGFPQDTPKIVEVCKKKVTDRILNNLKPFLNQHMTAAKERRIHNERKATWVARLQLLRTVYETALVGYPLYKPRPRVADIFEVPRIKSLVIDTPSDVILTENDFSITSETLADVIQEAYKVIEAKLLTVVAAALEEGTYDPATVLDLATTVFSVRTPRANPGPVEKRPLHTSRAIATSSTGLCDDHWDTPTHMERLLMRTFGHTAFHTRALKLDVAARNTYSAFLTKRCKLDPATTTCKEVEEKHPYVECLNCNRLHQGRLVMRWWEVGHHVSSRPYSGPCGNLITIEGEDLEKSKMMIEESDEKSMANEFGSLENFGVCLRCNENSSMKLEPMRRHLRDVHNVLYPKYKEDYEYVYNNSISPTVRLTHAQRLWPSRPT